MRNTRHRSRKQPKVSRTIPIYGDGLDSGVWYKCWHCNQLNNVNKSALGGSDSSDGIAYEDFADNPDYGRTHGIAVMGGIANSFTAQLNASDGNPAKVKNAIMVSDGGTGCSLCGSLNWRGDH